MFSRDGTYVIAGDLGGLGLHLCRFLATRGAKYVGLVQETEQQQMFVNELQQLGVGVRVIVVEPSNPNFGANFITRHLRDWPMVKGVIEADMLPQVKFPFGYWMNWLTLV